MLFSTSFLRLSSLSLLLACLLSVTDSIQNRLKMDKNEHQISPTTQYNLQTDLTHLFFTYVPYHVSFLIMMTEKRMFWEDIQRMTTRQTIVCVTLWNL